ncbi:MAG: hypothetical protein U1A07_05580 [Phenylobacterium sp.]|nr:hypothetical protein [Phenylobacterium sp.]
MTTTGVQATSPAMAPKQFIDENINLPLPKGMKGRIDAALVTGEKRVGFIRAAIEAELRRRERKPRSEGK